MVRERRKREKGKRTREKEGARKKKLNSPQDGLLLVCLGVGEALDGARLAPEEPAEVGALWLRFLERGRRVEKVRGKRQGRAKKKEKDSSSRREPPWRGVRLFQALFSSGSAPHLENPPAPLCSPRPAVPIRARKRGARDTEKKAEREKKVKKK